MKDLNLKKALIFSGLFFLIQSELFGQHEDKIVVIFTGSNNGAVSLCHCPPVPWGGLARRKSLLDSLKKRNECDFVIELIDAFPGTNFYKTGYPDQGDG
ncbi:hypothetical protein J7K93_03865 [bacterium]|nr:hypothetical protein [bacterium]